MTDENIPERQKLDNHSLARAREGDPAISPLLTVFDRYSECRQFTSCGDMLNLQTLHSIDVL